jgi:hypothetical protein
VVTCHGRPNSLAKVMVLFEVRFATQFVISIILFLSWDRIPRGGGHGYLSVVSVVCCQVEVFATS